MFYHIQRQCTQRRRVGCKAGTNYQAPEVRKAAGCSLYFKSFVFSVIIDIFFNLQINQVTLKLTLFPLFSESAIAAGTEKIFYQGPNPILEALNASSDWIS
jgi:hypothetical protein